MRENVPGKTLLTILILTGLLSAPVSAEITIHLAEEFPLRGEEVIVTVTDDRNFAERALKEVKLEESTVTATYRPSSETAATEDLGTLDASGQVAWTPTDAGIVTLAVHPAEGEGEPDATLATTDLSVRYGGFPPAGLLIMVIAGLLLFGGAAVGMALLLRDPLHAPTEEPPST